MKKQKIVEIVSDLLRAAALSKQIEDRYKRGELEFKHIEPLIDDKGQSILYRLKENCHTLFRHSGDDSCHEGERLLDLAIGSIFHEAMKLRENLYQVDMYRPRYLGVQKKGSPQRRVILERFEKIILRAEQGVEEGLADIKALFGDTLTQLVDLIRGYRENDLLVRFLLTQRKLFTGVYGSAQLERLFDSMFKKGPVQAYWVGAMSYVESAYYDLASRLFAKAIGLTPEDERLRFLYKYATGLDAYYSNKYNRALRLFGGLARLNHRFRGKRAYINQVIGVCRDIATDSLAQQDKEMALRARRMAQQLQTSRS